jgi:small ubiquitin-related modifier
MFLNSELVEIRTGPMLSMASFIELKIKDQDGGEVHFKVKYGTKMDKLFDAYCTKKGLDKNAVRFLFDGTRLNAFTTSFELRMESGDCIDAMLEQVGD